jgi:hypothetical protein
VYEQRIELFKSDQPFRSQEGKNLERRPGNSE